MTTRLQWRISGLEPLQQKQLRPTPSRSRAKPVSHRPRYFARLQNLQLYLLIYNVVWIALNITCNNTVLITGVSPASLGSTLLTTLYHHSPAYILLLSRTTSKVQEVVNTLPRNPSTQIAIVHIDLSSQTSVRKAAGDVVSLLGAKNGNAGIDIIFNNAGINISSRLMSHEGIELQFATNHLGPFLLTNLLLPTLLSSKFGNHRVVNTSSEAHRISPIRFTDYNLHQFAKSSLPEDENPRRGLPPGVLRNDGSYEPSIAYGQSKTANVLFSVALNERGVRSLAVMPGSAFPVCPFPEHKTPIKTIVLTRKNRYRHQLDPRPRHQIPGRSKSDSRLEGSWPRRRDVDSCCFCSGVEPYLSPFIPFRYLQN